MVEWCGGGAGAGAGGSVCSAGGCCLRVGTTFAWAGEGANLALEDAAQLAICLKTSIGQGAGTHAIQQGLSDFHRRRYPICKIVQRRSVEMSAGRGGLLAFPRPEFNPYTSSSVLEEYERLVCGI